MSGVTYRDATTKDAAMLAALARRAFVETFGHLYQPQDLASFLAGHSTEAWHEELVDPAIRIRLAEENGECFGYAKFGPVTLPVEPEGPAAELRSLYILKPWHGTGVAATLMDWVIAQAKNTGAEELYLSVFVDNPRARRFYERYGFRFVAPYAFMVGDHADEDLILRLDLKDRG